MQIADLACKDAGVETGWWHWDSDAGIGQRCRDRMLTQGQRCEDAAAGMGALGQGHGDGSGMGPWQLAMEAPQQGERKGRWQHEAATWCRKNDSSTRIAIWCSTG